MLQFFEIFLNSGLRDGHKPPFHPQSHSELYNAAVYDKICLVIL